MQAPQWEVMYPFFSAQLYEIFNTFSGLGQILTLDSVLSVNCKFMDHQSLVGPISITRIQFIFLILWQIQINFIVLICQLAVGVWKCSSSYMLKNSWFFDVILNSVGKDAKTNCAIKHFHVHEFLMGRGRW